MSKKSNLSQNVEHIFLDNGIKVALDFDDRFFNTAEFLLGFKVGSNAETDKTNGLAHYLEHMMFKGTEKRTRIDIAREIEDVGGFLNAYTSQESTAYTVKMLTEHIMIGVDVITDMVLNATFPEDEMEKEKLVVQEELNMYLDNPSVMIYENYCHSSYTGPIQRPIIGTSENIQNFTRQDLIDFRSKYFNKDTIFIALSGNFDREKVISYLNSTLGKIILGDEKHSESYEYKLNLTNKLFKESKKSLSQTQLLRAFQGCNVANEKMSAYNIAATMLGSGMSSRLFQSVREKLGYVYFILTDHDTYIKDGSFLISAGMADKNIKHANNQINIEIEKYIHDLSTRSDMVKNEMLSAKTRLISGIVHNSQKQSSRCAKILNDMMIGKNTSYQEKIETIKSTNIADVESIMSDIYKGDSNLIVYGGDLDNLDIEDIKSSN